MSLIELKPQPGPQTAYLSSPADWVFYGGGAGGGKTWSLLLDPIRHIGNPRYSYTIFRSTYPQITAPGGLLDASMEIYPLLGARLNRTALSWIFPLGAKVVFRPLKFAKDVLNFQGAELPAIAFDELCQFTEYQWDYLSSRNRSTCGVRPYMRATMNPDPDSWVKGLIDWFLDQDGYPDPDRSGQLRYFVREGGQYIWVDEDYRDPDTGLRPKSLTFIPSSVHDNPALLAANPEYLLTLKALPEVERLQLLCGNWKAKRAAGKFFKSHWFQYIADLQDAVRWVRFWDFASTEEQMGGEPDYTASCLMGLLADQRVVIADVTQQRLSPGQVEQQLIQTAARDGRKVAQRWQRDPGQAGVYQDQKLRSLLRGYDAKGVLFQISKQERAKPLSRAAEYGEVFLKESDLWNTVFVNELIQFPDGVHDDQVDASAGAYLDLTGEGALKFFTARFS